MGLFDWIVKGAGWHLGKAAVEEAIDSAKKKLREADDEPQLTEAERAKLRRAAEKEAEKVIREAEKRRAAEAKERAARAKQMERDVDRELRELKKKLRK